jgi:hypothetical protein
MACCLVPTAAHAGVCMWGDSRSSKQWGQCMLRVWLHEGALCACLASCDEGGHHDDACWVAARQVPARWQDTGSGTHVCERMERWVSSRAGTCRLMLSIAGNGRQPEASARRLQLLRVSATPVAVGKACCCLTPRGSVSPPVLRHCCCSCSTVCLVTERYGGSLEVRSAFLASANRGT